MVIEPSTLLAKMVNSGDATSHVESYLTNQEGQVGEALVEITDKKIDIAGLTERVAGTCPAAGAIATFIGTTRNYFGNREVTKLSYTTYTSMAIKEMLNITKHIFASYEEVHRVVISHKIGDCPVGEASVFIAVATGHRQEGLEACGYAINTLKAKVPVWKLEHYVDGTHSEGTQGCGAGGCGRKVKKDASECGGHAEKVGSVDEGAEELQATKWKRNGECQYKPPS